MFLIVLSNCWEIEHPNAVLRALDESAEHVIYMPACHHDNHARVGSKPTAPVVSEPIPQALACRLARGLGAALHRVVANSEVQLHAVDRAHRRRVAKRTETACVFD